MSYRFTLEDSVNSNVHRIALEEIESALHLLSTAPLPERDHAVHEARKSVKKVRGLLRLVAGGLGKIYRQENKRCRNIGRQLSTLRDAAALLEILDQLFPYKHPEALDSQSAGQATRAIRHALASEKRSLEMGPHAQKIIDRSVLELSAALQRVPAWTLADEGFDAIAPGLRRTYRRGRRALAKAVRHPTAQTYHGLRKRVKDHWYHVRLLADLSPEQMLGRTQQLKKLETYLGDDHNLAVLRVKLENQPEHYDSDQSMACFLPLLEQQQAQFRFDSLALASHLYQQKPSVFLAEMTQLWKASQAVTA